jgi:hypothetical protein
VYYEHFHTYPLLSEIKDELKVTYREDWVGSNESSAKNKK